MRKLIEILGTLGTLANALCKLIFNPDSWASKDIGLLEPVIEENFKQTTNSI